MEDVEIETDFEDENFLDLECPTCRIILKSDDEFLSHVCCEEIEINEY